MPNDESTNHGNFLLTSLCTVFSMCGTWIFFRHVVSKRHPHSTEIKLFLVWTLSLIATEYILRWSHCPCCTLWTHPYRHQWNLIAVVVVVVQYKRPFKTVTSIRKNTGNSGSLFVDVSWLIHGKLPSFAKYFLPTLDQYLHSKVCDFQYTQ